MRPLAVTPVLVAPLLVVIAACAVSVACVACSSKQGTIAGAGGGIGGTPQDESDGGLVSYPTAHSRHRQRGSGGGHSGTTPGQVIQDFKFLGYPNGDVTGGLKTVALSDYYDPTASKHKVLHIIAAAKWCTDCITEMSDLATALASPSTDYASQGVVYLGALIEGDTINIGATQTDLNAWIDDGEDHVFTWALDPEAGELGARSS